MNPRIYTYKVTFIDAPYWYWGVHKEKKFGEFYTGSPKTNKWAWEFYTPEVQILEVFEYTAEGWIEACKVEKRLIKPDLNKVYCLNEGCGGIVSLAASKAGGAIGGRRGGNRIAKERIGICSEEYLLSPRKRQASIKAGQAGKGTKKPGSGPKHHPIEVIDPEGTVTTFKTILKACDSLKIPLPTLRYYLSVSSCLVKGRFKSYTFRFKDGWKRSNDLNNG